MALFNADDLQTVRERSRIEDVIGASVTLRRAGAGTLVGLCPFHDEKTPSFHVTPSRGFYYCFGCGEGGDVIKFVQCANNESFVEAVEFLASRLGLALRYEDDGQPHNEPGLRVQILEANRVAAEFYAQALQSPEAMAGRQLLDERGFDREAATLFGVGYAHKGGRTLRDHLRKAKVRDEVAVKAGLVRENGYDFFQGRLLWPIRDAGHSVLGFGARKLYDDDRMPAKYLNTPESTVYKKSHVLYGLDLARVNIAKKNQAVVVEGYTDVMAAHLAGVDTAVASCGTAFGSEHARLLQRLLGTSDVGSGEVIFTFDGDAAGQKAALKVFDLDAAFTTQTYVAIEPSGLDPCDLRMRSGDAAVRELVGRRIALYEFVMRNIVSKYDLERVDSRLEALRAAARLINSVRDKSLANGYAQDLARILGMDIAQVRREVKTASGKRAPAAQSYPPPHSSQPVLTQQLPAQQHSSQQESGEAESDEAQLTAAQIAAQLPDPRDPALEPERGVLRLMLQAPGVFSKWDGLKAADFSHPAYRLTFQAIAAAGLGSGNAVAATGSGNASVVDVEIDGAVDVEGDGAVAVGGGGEVAVGRGEAIGSNQAAAERNQIEFATLPAGEWTRLVLQQTDDVRLLSLIKALTVEPMLRESSAEYAKEYSDSVRLRHLNAQIRELKGKVQRINPLSDAAAYEAGFTELVKLEAAARQLRSAIS